MTTDEKHYMTISPAKVVIIHGDDKVTVPREKTLAMYEALIKVPELKDGEEKTFELVSKDASSPSSSEAPYPGSPEWYEKLNPKK